MQIVLSYRQYVSQNIGKSTPSHFDQEPFCRNKKYCNIEISNGELAALNLDLSINLFR